MATVSTHNNKQEDFLDYWEEEVNRSETSKMTMSTNNCESMTSYFTNSYMGAEMHGHYPGNGVADLESSQQMHHYSQNPNHQSNMPYPRFPPYDRMGYYNQGMEHQAYSRPDSPSSQVSGGMNQPQPNGTQMGPQNQPQQQPVVYASCKLQAAVGGLGMAEGSSPPLEQMGAHHMNSQMTIPHHMGHPQGQVQEL